MIGIRNEIEYVEAYLAIQKQRYKEKLSYEIAFSPELYGFKIMKLLIQPLVENAIYHGIKGMDSPGHIKIIGERADSAVVIRVGDNGAGMSAEILNALNEGNVEPSTNGGVGVKNVQERIRLSFGAEYGVRLESIPGAGTTAVVRIPVILGDAT
jgi:two-component system sensor histidine kinase YesM